MRHGRKQKSSIQIQRKNIIRAASICIVNKGVSGCSMKDIEEVSNLSPGQIYRCYESKNEIVEGVIENNIEEICNSLPMIYKQQSLLEYILSGDVLKLDVELSFVLKLNAILRIEAMFHQDLRESIQHYHSILMKEHMRLISFYYPELDGDYKNMFPWLVDVFLLGVTHDHCLIRKTVLNSEQSIKTLRELLKQN